MTTAAKPTSAEEVLPPNGLPSVAHRQEEMSGSDSSSTPRTTGAEPRPGQEWPPSRPASPMGISTSLASSSKRLEGRSGTSSSPDTATSLPPLQPLRRASTYAPIFPSPLNPSPTASLKSRKSTASNEEKANPDERPRALPLSRSTPSLARTVHHGSVILPRASPYSAGRSAGGRRVQRPQSSPSSRPLTPMSISDLGRDYSRYPVPGSTSPYLGTSVRLSGPRTSGAGTPAQTLSRQSSNPVLLSRQSDLDMCEVERPFSPFLDDRMSAATPYSGGLQIPMFIDEKELDDEMHMPHEDDDLRHRPKLKDYLHREGIISLLGLIALLLGMIGIFILLPVLTYTGLAEGGPKPTPRPSLEPYEFVTDKKFSLFKNIRRNLIDSTTPQSAMTRRGVNGETLRLVFSDEFNGDGRTFYPGDDPYFTAPDIWYGATQDLDWYDPDAATTAGGTLKLKLDKFQNHAVNFRSGMLNTWNQLCFKGGALEVSLSLPGPAGSPGLWPGIWTMGNLGRPGYKASTEGVWPYTYDECDAGITPNQSSPDGLSHLPGQKLPACSCPGEDHPSPGTGRGAPEIDVIEASVDPTNRIGVVTQSFQVAPFDVWYRPDYDQIQMPDYQTTQINTYCGGPFQQAISGTTLLNNNWYDGKQYQKYAFEYKPGGDDGQIAWFVGDQMTYLMSGKAIGPNGNIGRRQVSQEPMSIVLNLGISNAWTWIDWDHRSFPTTLQIDYVRWYQDSDAVSVTCDPPGYPTTEYIRKHPLAYHNPNLTSWDETGYAWPKHKLNSQC